MQIEWNICSFFDSFSTRKIFCSIWVNLLLKTFSLSSKSVFVTKFARGNLASKTSAESILNSGVVIHLPWLWWVSFVWISLIFIL